MTDTETGVRHVCRGCGREAMLPEGECARCEECGDHFRYVGPEAIRLD